MSDNGIAIVDKPAGMTSHDVVDRARRIFGTRKVGHGGTLDPDATGVLVLGVGRATRFLSYAQQGPKRYVAVARFGITTSTQDASGEILETKTVSLDRDRLERAIPPFVGRIMQVPPMVSAVRVGGRRLHELARAGKEVARKARDVRVYELKVTDFTPGEYPEAQLSIKCSGGTYVRTLIHDLGSSLETGAHMVSLVRTEAGGFTLADAVSLDDLSPEHLRPMTAAVQGLVQLEVDPSAVRLVSNGRPLHLGEARLPG
ncbi:MAG TPA: tRNA pseudouridine(55) synthase TruB, partial [Actinomycetota bacterium]|nr:tRNA pseudouridine(55) synthase TruB [Actinomycetota bacterium]